MSEKIGYNTEVENLAYVSESIPKLPDPLIKRNFMLSSIEEYFKECDVVVLEGPDGHGKTTLLTQFVHRNPSSSVNIFITASRHWYQPEDVRRDICNQLHWILNDEEIPNDALNSSQFDSLSRLPRLVRKLSRRGRRGDPYYFIIDGINEVPEKDQHARQEIIEHIPFTSPGIRVLLSGSKSDIPDRTRSEVQAQSIAVIQFSKKETQKYLSDLVEDENLVEEIHNTCRGIPGRLASVRRILKGQTSAESILHTDKQEIQDLFEMEWNDVSSQGEENVLALLAHSDIEYNRSDIARILNVEEGLLDDIISRLEFLETGQRENNVQFVSDSFKRYAKKKLSALKSNVRDWIIEDLMEDLESERSLLNLPVQLHETGRYDDLVSYLSPERFYRLIESAQSVGLASQVADLASEAAADERDLGALARFSLHQSSVSEVWSAPVKRSRVSAMAALDNIEEALALVETTISDLGRLQLLAVIARKMKENDKQIDEEILEEIRRLFEEVESEDLSHAVENIAADLLYVDPKLALRLIEEGVDAGSGEHSLDVAYLKLSVSEALRSRDATSQGMSDADTLDNIQSKIEDPEVQRLSSKVGLVLGEYSGDRVIEEAEKFDKTGDKLLFLRKWTQAHSNNDGAADVIEYALREVIRNTNYGHDAGLLRELSEPLSEIDSNEKAEELIKVFDQQKEVDNELVEELVRLEINLAVAESTVDRSDAENRIGKIYFDLEEVNDLATRTEGLARLASSLPLGDELNEFEQELLSHTIEDLESCVDDLLTNSADQLNSTRQVIKGLASNYPTKALNIASRLNTEWRRDLAVVAFINAMLDQHLGRIEISNIFRAIEQIESPSAHNIAMMKIAERLSEENDDLQSAAQYAERLNGEFFDVYNPKDRCWASIQMYELLVRSSSGGVDVSSQKVDGYLEHSKETLKSLDDDPSKIDLSYQIIDLLSGTVEDVAEEFKELSSSVRKRIVLESENIHNAFTHNLRLAIRAYSGLLPNRLDVAEDQKSIFELIERVSSVTSKIKLFSDLAFKYFKCDRKEEGERVVDKKVRPLLSQITEDNSSLECKMWAYASPPLYLASNLLTLNDLEGLPLEYRDMALTNIAKTFFRGVMHDEPFDAKRENESIIRTEKVYELLEIMKRLSKGKHICYICQKIVENILDDKYRREYDKKSRVDIKQNLKEIVEELLPNNKFIDHKGYLIIAYADILRLRDTFTDVGAQEWIDLLSKARNIDNKADRALVLSKLVEKLPSGSSAERERRIDTLEAVEELVKSLPTTKDRLERLESLAYAAEKVDRGLAREYYRDAFSLLYSEKEKVESTTRKEVRKRLLSSAYRIDSEFASSLASLADEDPAHQELEQNIQRLKRRDQISSDDDNEGDGDGPDPDFPQVCWEGLAALNGGRVTPIQNDRATDILMKGRNYTLAKAYPVQSFAIQGLVSMYNDTEQANKFLRPVFEATLQNARFIERLAVRSSEKQKRVVNDASKNRESKSVHIGPGDRKKAMRTIKEWVYNNVEERVVICDPFFGPEDSEAIYKIQSISPESRIEILTSEKHHLQEGHDNIEECYLKEWKNRYDQEIPNVRIVVAGKQDGDKKSPVHDRWWLSGNKGLKMGGSFNGLGRGGNNDISVMSESENMERLEEVEDYLSTRARSHGGVKISYRVANL